MTKSWSAPPEAVRGQARRRDRVVVRLRDEPGGPEVVLIHPAAGEVVHYCPLARALPGPLTVLAVRSPLISDGTARFADLESMAADYLARLHAQGISRPALYGGWSLGGLIALEMAWQAHGDGASPPPVLAIDSALAAGDSPRAGLDEDALLTAFIEDVCQIAGLPQPGRAPVHGDRLLMLHAALQEADLAVPEQGPDWLIARFRAFNHHVRLAVAYRPRSSPYPGRVTLVLAAGREDRAATLDAWRAVAGSGLDVHEVPADHYSIVAKAHVPSIADALSFMANGIQAH